MILVKNLNGTSDKRCNCSSWLSHWEKYTNSKVTSCSVVGCYESNLVGGHVLKVGEDNSHYIIPLCNSHNQTVGEIKVSSFTLFASANIEKTCDK
jgi:hypothetical protein